MSSAVRFITNLGIEGVLFGIALVFSVVAFARRREIGLLLLAFAIGSMFATQLIAAAVNTFIYSLQPDNAWLQIPRVLEHFVAPCLILVAVIVLAYAKRPNHSTEPTPTSGTSAAEHPPRQP